MFLTKAILFQDAGDLEDTVRPATGFFLNKKLCLIFQSALNSPDILKQFNGS